MTAGEPGTYVRATHPYAYRSGYWAQIIRPDAREDGEPTWLVQFPDGATDVWVVGDPATGYEFSDTPPQ